MLYRIPVSLLLLSATLFSSWNKVDDGWLSENNKSFTLYYTQSSKNDVSEYEKLILEGVASTENFFQTPYPNKFGVYIHPDRNSLDSAWQKDWNMAGFKSECWMVASGVARKMDMIAPKVWDKESCEHDYADKKATQKLITHELIHVFHGQFNVSSDFSNTENIDWFVEGLATYASGQCTAEKIEEIKTSVEEKNYPSSLDSFWTGKLRYGLSGSAVMFIDKKFGRDKLKALLKYNRKEEILGALGIDESDLLNEWKNFIEGYPAE